MVINTPQISKIGSRCICRHVITNTDYQNNYISYTMRKCVMATIGQKDRHSLLRHFNANNNIKLYNTELINTQINIIYVNYTYVMSMGGAEIN